MFTDTDFVNDQLTNNDMSDDADLRELFTDQTKFTAQQIDAFIAMRGEFLTGQRDSITD